MPDIESARGYLAAARRRQQVKRTEIGSQQVIPKGGASQGDEVDRSY